MAIIDHPTRKHDVPGLPYYENSKVVQCDKCRVMCTHSGFTPGDAADKAREHGWVTIKGARLSDPKNWVCPHCQK